jgi:hypothetical protein
LFSGLNTTRPRSRASRLRRAATCLAQLSGKTGSATIAARTASAVGPLMKPYFVRLAISGSGSIVGSRLVFCSSMLNAAISTSLPVRRTCLRVARKQAQTGETAQPPPRKSQARLPACACPPACAPRAGKHADRRPGPVHGLTTGFQMADRCTFNWPVRKVTIGRNEKTPNFPALHSSQAS